MAPPSAAAGPTPPVTSPWALPPGSRVGGHVIDSVLAAGPFGIVYHAVDPMLRRAVALKEYFVEGVCVRDDEGRVVPRVADEQARFTAGRQAFVEEARLLAHLDLPGLLPVTGLFEDRGTVYRVMPHAPGRTLAGWRAQYTDTMDEGALRHLIADLMRPLEALHAANLVHGYVLPDQVILAEDRPALLLGFGTVRRTLQAPLDPAFTPIEQLPSGGHLPRGAWSDVYALAALVRFAMAPASPRGLQDPPTAHALRARAPIGPAFAQALERALSPQPGERPQTIAALREAMGPMHTPSTVHLDVTLPTDVIDPSATRPLTRASLAEAERLLGRTPIVRQTPPPPPWLAAASPASPVSVPGSLRLREEPEPVRAPRPAEAAEAAKAAEPAAGPLAPPEPLEPRFDLAPVAAASASASAMPSPVDIETEPPAEGPPLGLPEAAPRADAPRLDPIPQLMAAVTHEIEPLRAPLPPADIDAPAAPGAPRIEPTLAPADADVPAPPRTNVLAPADDDEAQIDDAVRAAIAAAIDGLPPAPPRPPVPADGNAASIPRIELPPFGVPLPGAPAANADEGWHPPREAERPTRRWMVMAAALLMLIVVAGIAWRAFVSAGPQVGGLGPAPGVASASAASAAAGSLSPSGASPASRHRAAA